MHHQQCDGVHKLAQPRPLAQPDIGHPGVERIAQQKCQTGGNTTDNRGVELDGRLARQRWPLSGEGDQAGTEADERTYYCTPDRAGLNEHLQPGLDLYLSRRRRAGMGGFLHSSQCCQPAGSAVGAEGSHGTTCIRSAPRRNLGAGASPVGGAAAVIE